MPAVYGADDLLQWFEDGRLVRPCADAPNFCDLVGALALLGEAEAIEATPGARRLADLIGPAEHHVFVLMDGLGCTMLERAPEGGFLRAHRAAGLRAVFPPTTAAALTSLATGEWPGRHAVGGWWLYLERFGVTATTLRFCERFSQRPLPEFGVSACDVYPTASLWPRMRRDVATVIDAHFAESTYSRYASGGTTRLGCRSAGDAVRIAAAHVREARQPSLTYLYMPDLDSFAHEKGAEHPGVLRVLRRLDEAVAQLRDALPPSARMVVSADHGLVDVPPERRFVLELDDPVLKTLACPPTCEPTTPVFHVRPGCEEPFQAEFERRWGEWFALISPDEAEHLRLFGPGPLAEETRRRLGTYLAVGQVPSALYSRNPDGTVKTQVGVHAGASPDEMHVPLIVA